MPSLNPASGLSAKWLLAAGLFWLGNVLMHLEFSNWIVSPMNTPLGTIVLRDYFPYLTWIGVILVAAYLIVAFRSGHRRLLNSLAWAATVLACTIATRILMTTTVETIHFLQYGILAYLFCLAWDRTRQAMPILTLLMAVTALGVVDELNQYFYLTATNSTYIDFNDFLLNQLGACGGLLAFYGYRDSPPNVTQTSRALDLSVSVFYAVAILCAVALWLSGRLVYSPGHPIGPGGIEQLNGIRAIFMQREPGLLGSWQPSFTGDSYYVLGAAGGTSLMLGVAALGPLYRYILIHPRRV